MSDQKPYRIGVISDTHGALAPAVFEIFDGVDLIIHSGDVGDDAILDSLATIAPLKAVSGNVDGAPTSERPLVRQLTTPAGRIAVTHGHLPTASAHRLPSMINHFRDFAPQIIVYGHTHLALVSEIEGVKFFNGGAAGDVQVGERKPSVGIISIGNGDSKPRFEHISLT